MTSEWMSAQAALDHLSSGSSAMPYADAVRTIYARARAGMIKAKAKRYLFAGSPSNDVEVPAEFWWAEDGAALKANWLSGDFETRASGTDLFLPLKAFGVEFHRDDILQLKPVSGAAGSLTSSNAATGSLESTSPTDLKSTSSPEPSSPAQKTVFIGHGRSLEWLKLEKFLRDRLHLKAIEFNSVSVAGVGTVERLKEMLVEANFALLILTADDEFKPRLNVVHECGLFQAKLGFDKAILLLEEGCEDFSNIHGLGHIPFPKGDIEASFERVRHALEREKVILPPNR